MPYYCVDLSSHRVYDGHGNVEPTAKVVKVHFPTHDNPGGLPGRQMKSDPVCTIRLNGREFDVPACPPAPDPEAPDEE